MDGECIMSELRLTSRRRGRSALGVLAGAAAVGMMLTACSAPDSSQPAATVTATAVETLAPETTEAPLAPLSAEEAFAVCDALILRETSDQSTYTHEPFADANLVQRDDGYWYVGVDGTSHNPSIQPEPVVSRYYCLLKGTIVDAEVATVHSGLGSLDGIDPHLPLDDPQWIYGPGGA